MRSRSGPTPGPTRERSVCARYAGGGGGIACERSGGYFGAIRSLFLSLLLSPSLPLSHSLGRGGVGGFSHSRTVSVRTDRSSSPFFSPPHSLSLSHSLGRGGLGGFSHSRTANTAHTGRSKERAGHGLMDYGVPKVLYVAVLSW